MRGDGTKLDITTHNPPPARLLDLTRLISRVDKVMTGVDRVELAYLRAILAENVPCFALVRTALGYVLLDSDGMGILLQRFDGVSDWGPVDRLSHLTLKPSKAVKRAQSDVRRLAIARCRPRRLPKMLAQDLPEGVAYINVGQSNITDRMMNALRYGAKAHISILFHDAIPLDFPQFQTPKSVGKFRAKLRRARAWADLIIYNSACTQRDVERHMRQWGKVPAGIVAHLGVARMRPDAGALPKGMGKSKPYFIIVSTIEPRKNHALLLDIWEQFAKEMPRGDIPDLYICGRRGWQNKVVFDRLDALPKDSPVQEVTELGDGALAALVEGAAGLLFPSFSEGYGLPPVEAAMLGVPVVCDNLDIYQEILGDYPVYADVKDSYLWRRTIIKMAESYRTDQIPGKKGGKPFDAPNWDDHFNIVLKAT